VLEDLGTAARFTRRSTPGTSEKARPEAHNVNHGRQLRVYLTRPKTGRADGSPAPLLALSGELS
jgi:hypothetical protein